MKQKFRLQIQIFLYILFPCVTFSQIQAAGSIAANATVIVHVAEFFSFHEGYAVIKNDYPNYALIDATGKIVIPYNKYQIKENFDKTGFVNGMCRITDASKKQGYINKQGNLVFPIQFTNANDFFSDGFAYAHIYKDENRSYQPSIIFKDGSRIFIKNKDQTGKVLFYWSLDNSPWSEGLCVINTPDIPGLFGYMNAQGKIVIPEKFLKAQPFSEGLAAVVKKDEFGNLKWGFINKSGQVVIPFQFTNEPCPFSGNLSLIKPLDIPEFNYCYIDKTGKVVLKIKKESSPDSNGWLPGQKSFGQFQGKLTIWPKSDNYGTSLRVLDKSGKFTDLTEFINKSGYKLISYNPIFENDNIIFTAGQANSTGWGVGVIKTNGEIKIPPVFSLLKSFDPISKLAYAEYNKGTNLIKGYINEEGIFVIVQGKKSGF